MTLIPTACETSAAPLLAVLSLAAAQSQNAPTSSVPRAEIEEAVKWIRAVSGTFDQHDYIVSASVRLLFFWVSRDDVGQGDAEGQARAGGVLRHLDLSSDMKRG